MEIRSAKHYKDDGRIAGVELVVFDGTRVRIRVPREHYDAAQDGKFKAAAAPIIIPQALLLPVAPFVVDIQEPDGTITKGEYEEPEIDPELLKPTHRYAVALEEWVSKGGKIG